MAQRLHNFHKFDDKAAEATILSIRMGNYAEVAAAAAGVKPDTFRKWLRYGRLMMRRAARCEVLRATPAEQLTAKQVNYLAENGAPTPLDQKLAKFCDDHDKALAYAEHAAVSDIKAAGRADWRASAWRLERMLPERWGRREKIEHSGPGGSPLATPQATLYLPPNGRDIEPDGMAAKVSTKQPPPVEEPLPPPDPAVERAAAAAEGDELPARDDAADAGDPDDAGGGGSP